MSEINDWNVSANSNNSAPPNGWPEGQNPSSVNDTAREGMAVVARWNKDINGSVAVAGTDTYTATINATTGFTLYDGYMFCGTFTNANTGAATLNLTVVATPIGAKAIIKPDGTALTGGEIPAGAKVSFKYDGTSFRMDSITHSTATTTTEGIAELATQAEVDAGTATDKIVTPETLAAYSGLATTQGVNRIINGPPAINQRGAQVAMSTDDYFVDRWAVGINGAGVFNGDLVNGYVEIDVTTADASMAATDLYVVRQRIEANNISDFNLGTASAKTVTLSFKHKHVKAGVYCVVFKNQAEDRNYIAEYTQSVSDTEETATITLTLDATGTWLTGSSNGMTVGFVLATGTTFQGSADTWQAGNLWSTSNQVNAMDSTSNYFRIKEVQLELGDTATDFEIEDYGTTMSKCERYYQKTYNANQPAGTVTAAGSVNVLNGNTTSARLVGVPLRTRMRGAPTTVIYDPAASNTTGVVRDVSNNAKSLGTNPNYVDASETMYFRIAVNGGTGASSFVAGEDYYFHIVADAEL